MVEWWGELSADELPSPKDGVKGEGEREECRDGLLEFGDSAPKPKIKLVPSMLNVTETINYEMILLGVIKEERQRLISLLLYVKLTSQ